MAAVKKQYKFVKHLVYGDLNVAPDDLVPADWSASVIEDSVVKGDIVQVGGAVIGDAEKAAYPDPEEADETKVVPKREAKTVAKLDSK